MEPREGEEGGLKPVADLKLCSSRKADKETFVGDDEYSMGMAGLISYRVSPSSLTSYNGLFGDVSSLAGSVAGFNFVVCS